MKTNHLLPSRKSPSKRRNNLIGILFVLPMMFGTFAFYYFPMIQAFIFSFQRTSGFVAERTWVGLFNYRWVLTDPQFWSAVNNTLYMGVLSIILNISVPFILASFLHSIKFGKNFFRSLFFVPNVVSVVASAILFSFVFHISREGLLNSLLSFVGIGPFGWFSDPSLSRLSVVLMGLWRGFGYNIIIFYAALQSVPTELYEAASVDGVSAVKRWWYITLPLMRPIIMVVVVMELIGSMRRFGDVFVIGGVDGAPGGSLQTVVVYIYRYAFLSNQVGIGSAASFILFFIIFILTLLNFRFVNKPIDD